MGLIKSYQTLKAYRQDPLGYIIKLHEQFGHRIHFNVFGKDVFIISRPEDVIHVLKTNNTAYTKGRTTKALRRFLGTGLITNEGDSWRKQHRLIRPIMNPKSVYEISPKILDTTLEFLPVLTDKKIDAFHEMNRLTWRIVLNTLFSQKISAEMDDWLEDILDMMKIVTAATRSSLPIPKWVPTKKNLRMKDIVKKFDNHVYGMIQQRRQGVTKQDLLQLLIDAREENGSAKMSDLEIRDEIMTFMMAGHETITNSMTWTLMELAKNKSYLDKLRNEAQVFFENRDFEILNSSPWITAVIDEVMRLWPPVWVFMRQAEEEDHIGEWTIPPKANVVLAPYLSHRAKDLWESPHEFMPERFLPEQKKKIVSGAFYPYGLGPRGCIGAYFAGMEAKIILATLVHHFEWDFAVPEQPQKNDAGISLRPLNNTLMNFRRRA